MINNIVHNVHPRAKRLSLRVDVKSGTIKLTIPKGANQKSIDRFLSAHHEWIANKQKLLKPKIDIIDGATIPFMGIDHHICIEHHTKRTTDISRSDDNIITIKTSRDNPTQNLKRWMIDQAKDTIPPLAHEKSASIQKTISKIDLRDPSSRWGSCSSDKRLMFSWRVIMAPPYVLDYLVAHEVAHLRHMNHSKAFWNVCYELSTHPEEGQTWLKHHGNDLMQWF